MKNLRAGLLLLSIVSAALVVLIAYRWGHEQYVVDNCLSGQHGSFDYSRMQCDLSANHPYVPYGVRHPQDGSMVFSSVVTFVLSVLLLLRIRSWRTAGPSAPRLKNNSLT